MAPILQALYDAVDEVVGVFLTFLGQLEIEHDFENEVLRTRPYLKKEWCIRVVENPIKVEPQEGNRFRFWSRIEELQGRILRIVTLEDKVTIHNAFPDRGFKP